MKVIISSPWNKHAVRQCGIPCSVLGDFKNIKFYQIPLSHLDWTELDSGNAALKHV